MVMPFIFFIPTGLAMTIVLGPILSGEKNDYVQYLYFFPQFPFTVIMVNLLDNTGLEFFEVSDGISWFFLIISTPLYFLAHLYVEAIMPDNYGISSKCCFCFDRCCKKRANAFVQEQEMKEIGKLEEEIKEDDLAPIDNALEKGDLLRRVGTEKIKAGHPI